LILITKRIACLLISRISKAGALVLEDRRRSVNGCHGSSYDRFLGAVAARRLSCTAKYASRMLWQYSLYTSASLSDCSSQCNYKQLQDKAVDPKSGANVMKGISKIQKP
jgi:hypothetical protein